jgi:thioester reductase-like protein
MRARKVLITGADGYLGLRLTKKYLEATEDHVVLWMRAGNEEEFRTKQAALKGLLAGFGARVSYHAGDLTHDRPFESLDPKEIRSIIHAAAVTRFNVDKTTARKINLEGAQKLFLFASRCPALDTVGLLSTVYASGLKPGVIEETALDGRYGFANYYEWSKWASEAALVRDFGHLPWRIIRIATIIADDDGGRVVQQNAFHNTLKLLYYGLLPMMPGQPETPLYLVSGEFVSRAIFTLMQCGSSQTIYHACHTREEAFSLGDLMDVAFETFDQSTDFKLRRILKPLYSDPQAFNLLAAAVDQFSSSVVHQAVSSVAPFARQLFIQKEVKNHNLVAALDFYASPKMRQWVGNACRYLVQTKWSRFARYDVR